MSVGPGVHRQRVDVVVSRNGIAGYYLARIERLYTLFHHPVPPVDKSFYTEGRLINISVVLPLGGAGWTWGGYLEFLVPWTWLVRMLG